MSNYSYHPSVAIISGLSFHSECIGFLLELLQQTYDIHVYLVSDNLRYVPYYKVLFPKVIFSVGPINTNFEQFTHIIKLTSNDPIITHPRAISILHVIQNKDISKRFIKLTPFIDDNTIPYMLPLYKIPTHQALPIICYVGYFLNSYIDDDLIRFISESKYGFAFIVWGEQDYKQLSSLPKLTVITRVPTIGMMNIITRSKFLMARKYPYQQCDRFSGAIALGLSSCKPLIIQKTFQKTYDIPAISFENNYSELSDSINNMTDEQYNNLVKQTLEARDDTINKNRIKINELLDRQI